MKKSLFFFTLFFLNVYCMERAFERGTLPIAIPKQPSSTNVSGIALAIPSSPKKDFRELQQTSVPRRASQPKCSTSGEIAVGQSSPSNRGTIARHISESPTSQARANGQQITYTQSYYIGEAQNALVRNCEADFTKAMLEIIDEHEKALILKGAIFISINNPLLITQVIWHISKLQDKEIKRNLYTALTESHLKDKALKAKYDEEIKKLGDITSAEITLKLSRDNRGS